MTRTVSWVPGTSWDLSLGDTVKREALDASALVRPKQGRDSAVMRRIPRVTVPQGRWGHD
jgi:hypothetical protein